MTLAGKFYNMHSFQGKQSPATRLEAELYDAEIIGEVPREINGALYRVGGDRYYPTLEDDVIINGDGLFSMLRFEDGHVDFKSRYVRTPRLLAERAARRRLYGKYRNKYTDDPEAPQVDRNNTGNTYAHWHAGRLFALREDSHPYMIDPETLDTKEQWDFDGKLKSISVCAHPKLDPVTGEWWGFGLFADGSYIEPVLALQVADREGNLIREEIFKSPFPGLSHDFAVTREHVIFDIMPLTVDEERMKKGGDFYNYDPSKPSAWGIMRRDGSVNDIRWFHLPNTFSGHIMNAFTEGDKVYVDATISPGNGFPFFPTTIGEISSLEEGIAQITRLEFDLSDDAGVPKQYAVPGSVGEMPRNDGRFQMERYRWGYFRHDRGIASLDWDNHQVRLHELPPGVVAQEPMFVPRSADAPEGDGWVMSMVNFMAENRAEFWILDAKNVQADPIARVLLPYRQSFSFHGSFVSLDQISNAVK
ncbi:carotenoid oxygenase family protein [Microbacterium sp. zg.B48]|uniref:carotenoid oxygenase family protein n=1 Tax=Microbacterium sp. zg.B48 TaxID=2969408 RepID=UPI00214B3972|nr:carotenoid oxygenase family protein [Microbacterium sp. zg.B48]MCR2764489.1 carotenoid oxygenase family protein [Microbacterium sp. zg.B48]